MNKLSRNIAMLTVAGLLFTANGIAQAQPGPGGPGGGQGRGGQGGFGGGNFDPAEMEARMMERYREVLSVADDDEWAIISERIAKVTEARRAVNTGGMRGMFGGRGGRGGGGGGGGRGGNFGGDQADAAQVEALQAAIDEGADTAEIKEKLAALRKVRAEAQAKLAEAEKNLKEVLNTSQEASAVLAGLLP